MNKIAKLFCALILLSANLNASAADTTNIASPDGKLQFKLFTKNNQLFFNVSFKNTKVIDNSPLIFTLDEQLITENIKKGPGKKYSINERYPWLGAHAEAVNHCNGLQIPITKNKLNYSINVRVFNNGAAFKFIIPGTESMNRIPDESTVFNIPAASTVWYHDMEMHYESVHNKKPITQLQKGEWVAPPGTFKLPQGIYAAITEADLKGFPGFSLEANGENGLVMRLPQHQPTSYPYRLRYSPEDTSRLKKPASITGTITTPWRVIIVGEDLNAMVNNDMVHNLCPPPDATLFPQGIKTSWIKPGRAVWKYLDGGGDGTLPVMKKFTDGAAALGFEHNILEGFWSRWKEEEIKELVTYSKQKNVGIWFWKHSKSLRDEKERIAFFKRCHDLGVAGVKIDFFDHEAKEVIDLYEAILRETAQYQLLADFHGANKPTGQARTWPNEMVRESVKGMEASKLLDRATHETTIPFTRWLAGPAEYTVMHFGERKKNTTWAHQIASAAILNAPLLTYAANPDSMLLNPAVEIIKAIPASWDETIVLPGSEIGELALFARRKGNDWFLAVMNGTQPKKIKLPLTFLKHGKFNAVIAADDPASAASVKMQQSSFSATDFIDLDLTGGGGFIARFTTLTK